MKFKPFSSSSLSFHMSWIAPVVVALTIGFGYHSINSRFESGLRQNRIVADYEEEVDAFLKRMGFEDFTGLMEESIKNENFLNPAFSKQQLTFYKERYRMYNHSRQIASAIMGELSASTRSSASRLELAKFIANLADFKPKEPPKVTPSHIFNLPEDERNAEGTKYAVGVVKKQIEEDTRILSADMIKVLYSDTKTNETLTALEKGEITVDGHPELVRLSGLIRSMQELVRFNYLDAEMGSFALPSLAKALVLAVTRHDKLKGNEASAELLSMVKSELALRNQHYENFVGTTLKIKSESGKYVDVKIQDGDHIHELSAGNQSHQITRLAVPGTVRNWYRAARHFMWGTLYGVIFSKDREDNVRNPFKRFLSYMAEQKPFRGGVSHIGTAEVLTDTEFPEITTTRAADAYIDAGAGDKGGHRMGGVRYTDIVYQFAKDSEFRKFVVSRFNHQKLFAWFKEYAKKVGYRKVVDMGDHINKDGTIGKANSEPWITDMTEEEFKKWANAPMSEAENFFNAYVKRVQGVIKSFLARGAGFAHGFSNGFGRFYCSKMILLAGLIAFNFDVQKHQDRWTWVLKWLGKIKSPEEQAQLKVMLERRIVAPAGLSIWNAEVGEKEVQVVTYPFHSEESREELGYGPERLAMDGKLLERLEMNGTFQKLTHTKHDGLDYAPTDLSVWLSVENFVEAKTQEGEMGQVRRRTTPVERLARRLGVQLVSAADAGESAMAGLIDESLAAVESWWESGEEKEKAEIPSRKPRSRQRRRDSVSLACESLFVN